MNVFQSVTESSSCEGMCCAISLRYGILECIETSCIGGDGDGRDNLKFILVGKCRISFLWVTSYTDTELQATNSKYRLRNIFQCA